MQKINLASRSTASAGLKNPASAGFSFRQTSTEARTTSSPGSISIRANDGYPVGEIYTLKRTY